MPLLAQPNNSQPIRLWVGELPLNIVFNSNNMINERVFHQLVERPFFVWGVSVCYLLTGRAGTFANGYLDKHSCVSEFEPRTPHLATRFHFVDLRAGADGLSADNLTFSHGHNLPALNSNFLIQIYKGGAA